LEKKSNRDIGDQPGANIAVCPPRVLNIIAAVGRRKANEDEYPGLLERVDHGPLCGGAYGPCLGPQQSCIYSSATGDSKCIGLSAFDVHVSSERWGEPSGGIQGLLKINGTPHHH
jgi:hypothetical protein